MQSPEQPLYARGKYKLERIGGRAYLQIVWYDEEAGRNRYKSAGSAEVAKGEEALDRLYMERERGQTICPGCGRPFDKAIGCRVDRAIADYLVARERKPSFEALRARLDHFLDFLEGTGRASLECDQVDERVIEVFREWSAEQPIKIGKTGQERVRALGTTEATVRTLAAAINLAHKNEETASSAKFTALPPASVSRSPTYRSSIGELAAMFRYCLDPKAPTGQDWSEKMKARMVLHRYPLLQFLRISVATWCRPDAAHDFSTAPGRDQWSSNARVIHLNPRGRRQTKKYRPSVPVPELMARLIEAHPRGAFVPVNSVRKAFEAMQEELGLPRERETGQKLIRRSIAQIARPRIGEAQWTQGEIMLGHRKASTSDIYALFDPANLGIALSVTEQIMNEIETAAPGAFTAVTPHSASATEGSD
jgi:hypothetical protein